MKNRAAYEELEKKIKALEQELQAVRESARESEERYRALFDRSFDAVFIHDFHGNFLDASDVILELMGYDRGDIKNLSFSDLIPEDQMPQAMDTLRELMEKGIQKKPSEFRIRRKDGGFLWVETNSAVIYREGKPFAIQGIARNITERKRAEELLKEREARYRTIFENTGNASILMAEDTTILLANTNFCRLTGYTREELEGRMSWTVFICPEDLSRMKEYHAMRRTDPGSAPDSYEFCLISRSGERRDIFLTVGLIPGTKDSIASCMDISHRKKAENALKESEERFRALQEASFGGIAIHEHGIILDCNQALVDISGYSMDELIGTDGWKLIASNWWDYVRERIAADLPGSYDAEGIRKDGSIFPIEIKGKNIPYHGRMARVTEIRDITERKRSEEALRRSEERYKNLLDSVEEAYYEVDLKGNFTYFNVSAMNRLGYDNEEMRGMNFRRFVEGEGQNKIFRAYHEVFTTAKPIRDLDWDAINKKGEKIPVESSVSLIKDETGKALGFRGVVRDVTERKRNEEALRQSEERFRDLARLLPETVYEADEQGVLTFVNEKAYEKFLLTKEDLEKGMSLLSLLIPEDRDKARSNVLRIMEGERLGLNEYTALRRDGTTLPVLIHSTAITKRGRNAGLRGFIIDVSDKKSLEEQFIRAQKMEAIGSLAGGIAHDFNNLLMGILGNTSLMLMDLESSHPFFDRLKNIEEYVRQGSDLTKQFLGFAQGGKYEVKPTHLGDFVVKSSEMFGRTKKEIRIHKKFQDDLWIVDVDRGQMEQVLLNLFVNAWQAMPGGGDLYLVVENADLSGTDAAPLGISPGRYVRVSVTDTGIGMDEATRARVFEPFFTTKEKGRGTGLGLASVYGILRNHKGFVTVESEKGAGSTFTIYIPASDNALQDEMKPSEDVRKGHGTVLLIDDERMILDIGSQMLSKLGYTVMTAAGGRDGIERYISNREQIDLVVLDMIMPGFGGRETFDRLKEINPDINVLLSSGYSIDGQAEEILERGCKGFIQKPFSMKELAGKIRDILGNR